MISVDIIWLIFSVIDIVKTIKITKKEDYKIIGNYINDILVQLEGYTTGFFVVHLCILFVISFALWMYGMEAN